MELPQGFGGRKGKRLAPSSTFSYENSEDAWMRIKRLVKEPRTWLITLIVLLLTAAGVAGVMALRAIHAPELPAPGIAAPTTHKEGETEIEEEEYIDVDDPRALQPEISGPRKEGYYTFLLLGTDKGGGNTDTIMVVSYDVTNQKLNLMSLPRDTMVNVGWDIKKINSVYSMRGLDGLKKQIRKLIGYTPDFYVKIDLNAFVEVVDLIGGVEVEVPRKMDYDDPYQDLHIHLKPGLQTLNGKEAMGLVRWRKSNDLKHGYDDKGRIETQQRFLKAAFKQCLSIKNWTKVSGYIEIFNRDVESDLELGEMLWFAKQGMGLDMDDFNTYVMPGNYTASAWSRSISSRLSYVTVNASEMLKLINESFNPYDTQVRLSDLDIMSINKDGTVRSSSGYVADKAATYTSGAAQPTTSKTAPAQTGGKSQTGSETTSEPTGETGTDPRTEPTQEPLPQEGGSETTEPGGTDEGTEPEGTGGEPMDYVPGETDLPVVEPPEPLPTEPVAEPEPTVEPAPQPSEPQPAEPPAEGQSAAETGGASTSAPPEASNGEGD